MASYLDQLIQEFSMPDIAGQAGITAQPQAAVSGIDQLQALINQQEELRKRQQSALSDFSALAAKTPSGRLLTENQTLGQFFSNPDEAQRAFMVNAGLKLAMGDSTKDLSARLAESLGQGVSALQASRASDIKQQQIQAKSKIEQMALEQEGLADRFSQYKDIASLEKQQQTLDLQRERFESPKYAPPELSKLQDLRGDLQNQLSLEQDPVERQRLEKRIFEIDTKLAPRDVVDPITGQVLRPRTTKAPTKTQLDLSSEMAGATTLASKVANVVYDPIAFEKSIGGREYVVPGIGPLSTAGQALLDPDVAGYVARRERIAIDLALPFMRALAPVTDTDAEKLQMTKGFEMRLSPEQAQKKWEREMLPENAALIYSNNMEYKGENPQQGPERAAVNMLKYAEKSFGDAMAGRKMTIYNQAQQTERLNDLLAMYPSTSQASNLQGSNGAYEINGRVVSDQFIMNLAKSMDVTPDDLVSVLGIKPF